MWLHSLIPICIDGVLVPPAIKESIYMFSGLHCVHLMLEMWYSRYKHFVHTFSSHGTMAKGIMCSLSIIHESRRVITCGDGIRNNILCDGDKWQGSPYFMQICYHVIRHSGLISPAVNLRHPPAFLFSPGAVLNINLADPTVGRPRTSVTLPHGRISAGTKKSHSFADPKATLLIACCS